MGWSEGLLGGLVGWVCLVGWLGWLVGRGWLGWVGLLNGLLGEWWGFVHAFAHVVPFLAHFGPLLARLGSSGAYLGSSWASLERQRTRKRNV